MEGADGAIDGGGVEKGWRKGRTVKERGHGGARGRDA
jgi:hypothetical protein